MAPAINHTGYTGLPSLPLACLLHLIAFFYDGSVNDQCVEGDTEAAAGVKEKEGESLLYRWELGSMQNGGDNVVISLPCCKCKERTALCGSHLLLDATVH